uniref:PDZ domain-containing protein n=2 Tax=Hymenolepis diminuta TaxID=6216 RepID=A0A158QCF6_HYMDI
LRGIGLSGPCKTPDFVPASVYIKSQKLTHDIASGDDTTVAESIIEFSPSPAPASAPSSPLRKPNSGSQYVDNYVRLLRGPKGFGLRLIGGAEEGTQVRVGALTPGGQAELSGNIFPGDLLIAINGVSVVGATHSSVIQLLSAAAPMINNDVNLTLRGQRPILTRSSYDSSTEQTESIQTSPLMNHQQSFRRSFSENSSIHSRFSTSSSSEPNSPIRRLLNSNGDQGTRSSIFKVKLHRRPNETFGFSVNRSLSPDRGCHIGAITPGGPAARSKRIQIGDKIVEINGHSLAKQSHSDIVEQLCTQHHRLELTLERLEPLNVFRIPVLENNCRAPALLRSGSRSSERRKFQQTSFLEPVPEAIDSSWNSRSSTPIGCSLKEAESYNVELLSDCRGFGFSVRMSPELQKGSMVILRIEKGSPAYNDRKMQVGDKVLEINGVPTESLTYTQAVKIVKFGGDHLQLKLRRVNTRAYDLSI